MMIEGTLKLVSGIQGLLTLEFNPSFLGGNKVRIASPVVEVDYLN